MIVPNLLLVFKIVSILLWLAIIITLLCFLCELWKDFNG